MNNPLASVLAAQTKNSSEFSILRLPPLTYENHSSTNIQNNNNYSVDATKLNTEGQIVWSELHARGFRLISLGSVRPYPYSSPHSGWALVGPDGKIALQHALPLEMGYGRSDFASQAQRLFDVRANDIKKIINTYSKINKQEISIELPEKETWQNLSIPQLKQLIINGADNQHFNEYVRERIRTHQETIELFRSSGSVLNAGALNLGNRTPEQIEKIINEAKLMNPVVINSAHGQVCYYDGCVPDSDLKKYQYAATEKVKAQVKLFIAKLEAERGERVLKTKIESSEHETINKIEALSEWYERFEKWQKLNPKSKTNPLKLLNDNGWTREKLKIVAEELKKAANNNTPFAQFITSALET